MKLTKITTAMIAMAAAAVLGTAAHAQVAGYSEGDLLIGFEQQNGSGGITSNDYVVDLGSANHFIDATVPLSFNLSTTNLVSAFGSSWASNTATNSITGNPSLVQWGVVGGTDGNGPITLGSDTLQKNTLFYTQGELTAGTHTTAPTTASNSNQGNINGNIQEFAVDYQGTNPGVSGSVIASNDALGWSALGNPSSSAFGSGKNIEQPSSGSYTGPTDSELDLYELPNTTQTPGSKAILLGDFTLSSSGVLTFTTEAAAVPEPSAYSLALVAAGIFVVLRRRKALLVQ